jgi:hemolysin activation/secretion protein
MRCVSQPLAKQASILGFQRINLTLLLALQASFAWCAEAPDAGKALQQVQPPPSFEPKKPAAGTAIPTPSPLPAALDNNIRIKTKSFEVSGNTVFTESALLALINDAAGKELTLLELRELAKRLSQHYQKHGYLVAHAYLPAQDIREGKVEFAVIEGHYGKIDIRNAAGLHRGYINQTLDQVSSGNVIEKSSLERSLLLLNDTPGIQLQSTLEPGETFGTSDLIVDISKTKSVSGVIDADNFGNRFTGRARTSLSINFANPIQRGDQLTMRAATTGPGLRYGRLAYSLPVAGQQTILGAAYSSLAYELREDFANLRAHGKANLISLYGSHSFIRSLERSLTGQLSYEEKRLEDRIDAVGSVVDKKIQSLSFNLGGDSKHLFSNEGLTSFTANLTAGRLTLDEVTKVDDTATAKTAGGFGKFGFTLNHQQTLAKDWLLAVSTYGQLASKNLDSSEKFSLGGPYAVRAYPQGEAAGDEGFLLSAEMRRIINPRIQLSGFMDFGKVKINKRPWLAGNNQRTLSGAGLGLHWLPIEDFLVRLSYAHRLGSEDATSDRNRNGYWWVRVARQF